MIDFSVLIPVYNTRPEHLLESVSSVINQSLSKKHNHKYNVVIVDDGSTDKGTLFALQYLRTLPEIKVFTHEENQGTSAALNTGHKLIESTYIAVMGSDDIAHKERFFMQAKYLSMHADVDVLGSNISSFYNDDMYRKPIYTSTHIPSPSIKSGWQTNHGTVMYKNQSVKDVGGYDIKLRRGQDIDLWRRMMTGGKVFRNLHDNLYMWRRFRS